MAKAKKPKLVTQYLENVSREMLGMYPQLITGIVGERNGVYALYKGDKLYYVGLAKDLHQRLGQHLKNQHAKAWDSFSVYLTIGAEIMPELEAMIVRIVEPSGNTQIPRLSASHDMLPQIERAMKKEDQSMRDFLLGYAREDDADIKGTRHLRPIALRGFIAKRAVNATMRRDGSIRYAGNVYKTPSAAAKAACGGNRNGWSFWKYERGPGDWVFIDAMRRK